MALMLRMHVPLTKLNLWGEHNMANTAPRQWLKKLKAGNEICAEGARGLSDALKTNTTLTELCLWCEQQDHKETQQERARQAQWHVVTDRQLDW